MIPKVSPELRQTIAWALDAAGRRRRGAETPPHLRPIAPDLALFHQQAEAFARHGLKQRVAILRDEDEGSEEIPVLLAPDPTNFDTTYDRLLATLERSGLEVQSTGERDAESIMIDRLAEYLAVRNRSLGPGGTATVVDSRRSGDTILVCKGYFLTTATAFGLSTPAIKTLPSGRYTFGLTTPAGDRFDGVIWTCPTKVRLNLP